MSASNLDGLHILFVDDSEDERELFEMRAGMLGASVVAVGSAHEAVDEIVRGETDVVVCDMVLPDVDGCDLVQTLQEDEVAATIPVIAATGLSGLVEQDRAMAAGFSGYISKPYSTEDLVAMIMRVRPQIDGQRRTREQCRLQVAEQRALRERLAEQRARSNAPGRRARAWWT